MAAKRFKLGDMVMIRQDLKPYVSYGDIGVNPKMAVLAGRMMKINAIVSATYNLFYHLDGGDRWLWDDEMLVPVPEEDINDGGYDISDLLEGFGEGK